MIPNAIQRALCLPKLDATQFMPTKWSTVADKAKFGDRLLRFIAEDCPERLFTTGLYRRLSLSFGHIACYNRNGFYAHFFSNRRGRVAFLDQTSSFRCYGDPAFTFSDLERVVTTRLKKSDILAWQRRLLVQETETSERALLVKLEAKYRTTPPAQALSAPGLTASANERIQHDLFGRPA
jgi:hypothetical protein